MKIFKDLQSLWSYSLNCPICKNTIRDIDVMIGPEYLLDLKSWQKIDHNLILKFKNKTDNLSVYTVEINCINNLIRFNNLFNKDLLYNLYLYIFSNCGICDCYINSADIAIKEKLENIGIEQEGINLVKSNPKYHLVLNYEHDFIIANKIFKNKNGEWKNKENSCKLPMINFDFKNQREVVKKIESLILFS